MHPLQQEINRKSFHLSALAVPVTYYFLPKHQAMILLSVITPTAIAIDVYRHQNLVVQQITDKIFASIMRPDECSGKFKLSGTTYMLASFLFTGLLFEKSLAITAWNILIFADAAAALVGKKFGSFRNKYGKSIEGGLAFFITALITVWVSEYFLQLDLPNLSIVVGCLVAALAEFHNRAIQLNDNFTIPLAFAATAKLIESL